PVEQLPPLLDYQAFVLDDEDAGLGVPELGPCSTFPAGLVPRFSAALKAGGYKVSVDDRRRFEEGFRVNQEQYRESYGEARAFLRAVLAEPLGQVTYARWHDFLWRIGQLCYFYADARVLIVTDCNAVAVEVYNELYRDLRRWLGLLAARQVGERPRCLVTTLARLPGIKPGVWQILLPIVCSSKQLSRAAYEAVVRMRARLVFTFIPHGLRLGRPTRLRLEALSGRLIDASPPPVYGR